MFGGSQSSKMRTKFTVLYSKVKNMRTGAALYSTSLFDFCVVVLAECFLNGRSMRTGQKRSVNMITPTEILTKRTCELFKIGVDLNGMSASEYLPLYQSFTNRTHTRNGRRFDQSNISQTIEKNICCSVILSRFDTIKKYTSRRKYRVTV